MRKPCYLLAALALLAAAGCSRADGIVAPERTAAPHVNNGGTTTSTTTSTTPTPTTGAAQGDSTTTRSGNGLLGSGA